jgi:thiamine pyrophosphokinase
MIIGDMDSIAQGLPEELGRKGTIIEFHPADKDCSDGELAIEKALEYSPAAIDVYGGKCGRADHILSSYHLLFRIPEEIRAALYLEGDEVILIREGRRMEINTARKVVSILPASEEVEVSTFGLKWELKDHTIEMGSTLGIHNEPLKEIFSVDVKRGNVFVILSDYL